MAQIAIDCRFSGTVSGLGRYTREIVPHLLAQGRELHFVLLVRSLDEPWLAQLPSNHTLVHADIPHYSLQEQLTLPGVLRATKADLLFAPHFNVPLLCPLPFVVTIHDLILHRYPNQASWMRRRAYRLLLKRCVARAAHILTISNFVKEELRTAYGPRVAKKATTVYEGVHPRFSPRPRSECELVQRHYRLEKPYFLYVGNAKEHKNVQLLIDAFTALHDDHAELILVMHGSESTRLTLRHNVRTLSNVDDDDLPALYSGARACLTASLYEGFCLPLLEARACDCPVIATASSAISELLETDRGAKLVVPTLDAFTHALRHIPERRPPPLHFSWEETARTSLDILRHALQGERKRA